MMMFYFYPSEEQAFKKMAQGNYVRTIVVDSNTNQVMTSFCRRVEKYWSQTCRNNIETDHELRC